MSAMRPITMSKRVYIIAEIGMNHDGDVDKAKELIIAASKTGVNAVKFQMHISSAEMLPSAPPPPYFSAESRWDYFNRTAFSDKEWVILRKTAHKNGVHFIVSPFSEKAVKRCRDIGIDCYKIASGEVNNVFLLESIEKTKIPSILSTGMSSVAEIDAAIGILARDNNLIAVLQCSSQYPCPPQNAGLNVMEHFIDSYCMPIGLSDHTLSAHATYAAVSLGAAVIERHFTLSKKDYGADAKYSLEPQEMRELVRGIRTIEKTIRGTVNKDDLSSYKQMRFVFGKSIVAKRLIKKGETVTMSKLTAKKPASGLSPDKVYTILGKKAKKNIKKDDIIRMKDVQ